MNQIYKKKKQIFVKLLTKKNILNKSEDIKYKTNIGKLLRLIHIRVTRPKPVEHGYVLSMAVGTIGEW